MSRTFPTEFQPGGLATGIGSLPFTDPQAALSLILSELPDIPHWPQLPRRSPNEHFVRQFLQPLVTCGLVQWRDQRWSVDPCGENHAAHLTEFYSVCLPAEDGHPECLDSFLPPPDAAAGFHAFVARAGDLKTAAFVKGQVAGPLSVGLELKDPQGRPAYYDADLRDTIVRTLSLNARCQAAALAGLGPAPIVFVDDPAVRAWGSRLHLSLEREAILADLNAIFSAIRSGGGLAGFHACEAVDWSLVLASQTQILSLDAYRYGASLTAYTPQLQNFLQRGGVIAWGMVPTLDDPFAVSAEALRQRLEDLWQTLFPGRSDRRTLVAQSMLTPACGTGLLSDAQARRIYRLTAELSALVRTDAGL